MSARVVAETVVVIFLTAALTIGGFALLELGDGASAGEAFLTVGPQTALGFAGVGFGVWMLAILVGNVLARHRSSRLRFLISILAGIGGAIVNLVGWGIVAITGGGWAMLTVAFGLTGSVILVIAVVLASLLTSFVIVKRVT